MKFKLASIIMFFNVIMSFSQAQEQNNSGKRIIINNPTEQVISELPKLGIDLRCGAVFNENALYLEIGPRELENLKKSGIPFEVEIDDLTKFYTERFKKELPFAKAKLAEEKAKSKNNRKNTVIRKSESSISNVILDNPLQYYGETEIDWEIPTNFDYGGNMGGCLTVLEMEAQLDLMKTLYPTLITTKKSASPDSVIEDTDGILPDHAKITNGNTYGTLSETWPGQTIYFVKISDGIAIDDNISGDLDQADEPDILYTSMIHSRELSALMGNIYFMWYLLENYATDAAVKSLVDNNELFFVPVVNPDGLRWNEIIAPNGGGMQRKNLRVNPSDNTSTSSSNNSRGVDVNRNFDYLWGSAGDPAGSDNIWNSNLYRGPDAFSEPESQIMRDFVLSKDFKTAVWHHTYANAIPHPYGGIPTKVSGREDEMHKWHEDMTRYNRYIYGARVLNSANGIADDWMLGGMIDANGSTGSGMNILATTPENGHYNERDISNGFSGFWPSLSNIVPIAKRMMRINFMNAYYGGKYAKFHDLTQSNITSTTTNLSFGIERIGQTPSDFTITVTPISGNINSVGAAVTKSGMAVLVQENLSIQLVLDPGIAANDKIEYKVTLSNSDFIIYEATFEKYYNPTVIFEDNPDTDISMANWVETSNWSNSTVSSWSGSRSIKAGSSIPYLTNISNTLTTTNSYNLSGSNKFLVQFYSKWDLERNFDYVEILGSSDNGSTWVKLKGKYNKPESTSETNDARQWYDASKNSYFSFQSNSSGLVYDGNQMDNWVLEEIIIDASNNSALLNATNAKFRFNFRTDGNNRAENYSTNFDGFYFDDFKIIEIPCIVSLPTGAAISSITNSGATTSWNTISSVVYDIRYKKTSSSTWIEVPDITINTYNLTGLAPSTEYEVQVRSKCDISTTSAYSSSVIYTTTAIPPCTGAVFSDFETGYSESFNIDYGKWTNLDGGWTPYSGTTPSNTSTGPSTDGDGGTGSSNKYLYTESSTGQNPGFNGTTYLESSCFDLSGVTTAAFSFAYHMYGSSMGTLTVEVSMDDGNTWLDTTFKNVTDNVDLWQIGTINLNSYLGNSIKIRFIGKTGTSYLSDMAIDNFSLTATPSVSLGIQDEILSTFQLYPNPSNIGEIRLKVPNEIQEFNVVISNILGQKLYSNTLENNNSKTHKINTQGFKTGVYFVTVSTNLGKSTKKLIIE